MNPSTLGQLIDGCDEESHPSWAERTKSALARMASHDITTPEQLVNRLQTLPAEDRVDGTYLLQELGQRKDVALLTDFLRSYQNSKILYRSIEVTGRLSGDHAVQVLQKMVKTPTWPIDLRSHALYQLTFLHNPSLIPWFIELSTHVYEPVTLRGQAIEGIAHLSQNEGELDQPIWQRAQDTLLALLDDTSGEVRFWSMFALGAMGAKRALPLLEPLAQTDGYVGPFGYPNFEEAKDMIYRIRTGRLAEPDAMSRKIMDEWHQ